MISIILMLVTLLIFIISLIVGNINYRQANKEKESFSFLNQFPYEMQNLDNMRLSFLFRILISLFAGSLIIFGTHEYLFMNIAGLKSIHEYIIGIIFILLSLVVLLLFFISLNHYKTHLILASLLFVLTTTLYVYVGIFPFFDPRNTYSLALSYITLIIGGMLLVALLFSPLKKWMYLEKKEEDGVVTYVRKKISILPLMEWIYISFDILLIILIALF